MNGNPSGWEGLGTISSPSGNILSAWHHTKCGCKISHHHGPDTPSALPVPAHPALCYPHPATGQSCISAPRAVSPCPCNTTAGSVSMPGHGMLQTQSMLPGRWLKPGVGAAPRSHSCPASGLAAGTCISKESSCPKTANPEVEGKYLKPSLSKVPKPWGQRPSWPFPSHGISWLSSLPVVDPRFWYRSSQCDAANSCPGAGHLPLAFAKPAVLESWDLFFFSSLHFSAKVVFWSISYWEVTLQGKF